MVPERRAKRVENSLSNITWNWGKTNPIKGLKTKAILLEEKDEFPTKIPSQCLDS